MSRFGALFLLLTLLSGCSNVRNVEFRSEPADVEILIDGTSIGTTPVSHDFNFANSDAVFTVNAQKEGYVPTRKRVSLLHLDAALESRSDNSDAPEYMIVKVDEDESWTKTAASEAANTWFEITINPQLAEAQVWEKLIETLVKYYPEITNQDNESGYVVTRSKEKRFKRGPTASVNVRNQFFCSMATRSPLVYKVKIESQINDNDGWQPFERVFQDDAHLIKDLEAKLALEQ
jgi:hypothetical protein